MTSATDNPLRLKRRAEEHLDRVIIFLLLSSHCLQERVEATVEVIDFSIFSELYSQSFDNK